MKRKIIAILLSVVLIFLFTGCKDNNVDESKEFVVELNTVYENIINLQSDSSEELILFPETSEDYINELYAGLNEIEIDEKTLYVHPIGMACEIALVKVKNSEDVEKVKAIFEQRIDKGAESAMCDSESQDIWKKRAEVQTKGNYVCMIVLPDGYVIPENVFEVAI